MSELPGDLLYTNDHEWLRREDDGAVTIGITDHAATSLGDLVYVELPEVGQEVESAGEMAVVESVKAASDVYAPIAGSIVAVNEELADDPEKINTDPAFIAANVSSKYALAAMSGVPSPSTSPTSLTA